MLARNLASPTTHANEKGVQTGKKGVGQSSLEAVVGPGIGKFCIRGSDIRRLSSGGTFSSGKFKAAVSWHTRLQAKGLFHTSPRATPWVAGVVLFCCRPMACFIESFCSLGNHNSD
jgi:hypothetical protein